MRGFVAILLKEFTHIRRQRTTIFFAIVVPAVQLVIFGLAANQTIEHIPLIVLDLDGRQEGRRLVESFVNTQSFEVVARVGSIEEVRRAIGAGTAKAALIIPPDLSEKLLRHEQATVQLLVDGSDSQTAMTAMNATGLLVTTLSIERARQVGEALQIAPSRTASGALALPLEARTRLLFNPNLEDAHFFVPGLIAIILQFVLSFLTSFSVVGERERGTLEQLFVTPVSGMGLLLGKLTPYVLLATAELLVILVMMVGVFGVPIHGNLALLLAVSALFVFTVLGMGLLISTVARTQLQAMQGSFLLMLPSVLLSGFIFPRAEMPLVLQGASYLLPVTYFLEIVRGVVLRASHAADLAGPIGGLAICAIVILALSLLRFHKQLD